MSLFSYIEEQRKKPEEDRRKMTLVISLSVTAIVFLLWLFAFVHSITRPAESDKGVFEAESYEGIKGSWSDLVGQFSDLFDPADATATEPVIEPEADPSSPVQ